MKGTLAIVVLLVVALGAGAGWYLESRKGSTRHEELLQQVTQQSNQLSQATAELGQLREKNTQLEQRLTATTSQLMSLSNQLTVAQAGLKEAQQAAAEAARAAEQELQKREARIAELEVANKTLEQQARDTEEALHDLEARIAEKERQLAAAQGDREFLLRELQRLQTEKAELERRFNDLVVLQEQVRRIQRELAADQELDVLRARLARRRDLKGAELLMRGFERPMPPAETGSGVDLEVEVHREGGATIQSGGGTGNTPQR
ncbi:MAG: hypothetical protein D6766_07880 [Verrucomicrobia bacterium]|nr:MAG: hypothetical protein D6766_07880 [Verrucomicrobiota bacterium]